MNEARKFALWALALGTASRMGRRETDTVRHLDLFHAASSSYHLDGFQPRLLHLPHKSEITVALHRRIRGYVQFTQTPPRILFTERDVNTGESYLSQPTPPLIPPSTTICNADLDKGLPHPVSPISTVVSHPNVNPY
ncbi:hypothetical protein F4860DRAFT_514808 [Xylaria cubensis]|nr:hypothetical protein F4860DRAFT_514808 [Xylaria cubensis]